MTGFQLNAVKKYYCRRTDQENGHCTCFGRIQKTSLNLSRHQKKFKMAPLEIFSPGKFKNPIFNLEFLKIFEPFVLQGTGTRTRSC